MTMHRHGIVFEITKELRVIAANRPEAKPAPDQFEITINLGADHVERYSKSIEINAADTDPFHDTDTTSQEEWLPVIAAKKSQDGGMAEMGNLFEQLAKGRASQRRPSIKQAAGWLKQWDPNRRGLRREDLS